MSERPLTRVMIRQWQGLASNRSPLVRKYGEASAQINCHVEGDGVLKSRLGYRPANGWSTTSLYSTIVSVFNDQTGDTSRLVIHTAAGYVNLVTGVT